MTKRTSFRCIRCRRLIRMRKSESVRGAVARHYGERHRRLRRAKVRKKPTPPIFKVSPFKPKPIIKLPKGKSILDLPLLIPKKPKRLRRAKPRTHRRKKLKIPILGVSIHELQPIIKPPKIIKEVVKPKPRRVKVRRKTTGKPMPKALQVQIIKKMVKKRGIEPDLVPVHDLVGSKEILKENIKTVLKAIGKRRTVEPEEARRPEVERFEEDWLEDTKGRIARGENGYLKGLVEGYERRKGVEEYR